MNTLKNITLGIVLAVATLAFIPTTESQAQTNLTVLGPSPIDMSQLLYSGATPLTNGGVTSVIVTNAAPVDFTRNSAQAFQLSSKGGDASNTGVVTVVMDDTLDWIPGVNNPSNTAWLVSTNFNWVTSTRSMRLAGLGTLNATCISNFTLNGTPFGRIATVTIAGAGAQSGTNTVTLRQNQRINADDVNIHSQGHQMLSPAGGANH